MADRRIVEAREPFSVTTTAGTPLNVSQGDLYYADDPLVTRFKPSDQARLFGELQVKSSSPTPAPVSAVLPDLLVPSVASVETTTAGPGERRRITRGRSGETREG